MKLVKALLLLNLVALGSTPVWADELSDVKADQTKIQYRASKNASQAEYDVAKENCKNLAGNARDVCMKDAKAQYKTEKAGAKAVKKSDKALIEAEEASMKAHYQAARERCDALNGNAKEACIAEAKLAYPK